MVMIEILLVMLLATARIKAFASSYVVHNVSGVHYRDIDLAVVVHIDYGNVHVRSKGIIVLVDGEIVLIIAVYHDVLRDITVDFLLTHKTAI